MGPRSWLAAHPHSGAAWVRTLVQEIVGSVPASDVEVGELLTTAVTYDRHIDRFGATMYGFVHVVRHPADVLLAEAARTSRSRPSEAFRPSVPLDADQLDALVLEQLTLVGPAGRGVGSWADHTASWLDARADHPHILLRFEDLGADPRSELRRLACFLGVELGERTLERIVRLRSTSWLERLQAPALRTALGRAASLGATVRDRIVEHFGEQMGRLGYSIAPERPVVALREPLHGVAPLPVEALRSLATLVS